MNSQDKGLIYLYCLTNKIPKLSRPVIETKAGSRPLLDGMAGKEVENFANNIFSVYHEGLYAIVGKVKESEFSEENLKKNLADLEWIKTKAAIHEKIIEWIMSYTCVIPFKFGTIFNTEDNLKTMLDEHKEEFKRNLMDLEGKEEWGVKIYAGIEKLKGSLSQEDKELLNIDKEINSASPGKAFLLKKKKEELLNTVMNKKLNEYGQYSFERLSQYAIEKRINKLLPKEVTERNEEMILNSAFLIIKNEVEDFLNIVEALRTKYTDKGFFFDCTGPWPPYNFCEAIPA
ncbi:MAG: GvpL/GvpF family gas vesicle protein [Pseudomonadota bacterium]